MSVSRRTVPLALALGFSSSESDSEDSSLLLLLSAFFPFDLPFDCVKSER